MENQIILKDGSRIDLSEYQRLNDLPPDKVADHFSVNEYHIGRFEPFEYSELLWNLLELFRIKHNAAVHIGAAFRTREHQQKLIKKGLRAAKVSPHEKGMAADIDTKTNEQTLEFVKLLKESAKDLGLKIRLGYVEYWEKDGDTFVHVDVCPEYYAPGKPFYNEPHPPQWERAIEW